MRTQFISAAVLLAACVIQIQGHSYFSSINVDGKQYKENECIRPHPSSKYDYPISLIDNPSGLYSESMTCGWEPASQKAANKKCPVNPGSTLVLQWHYEMGSGDSDTFIIDPSHRGPCLVYMAKSETGKGPVWFKIFEDGYDTSTKKFCVDKLRANKGKLTITIPTDITPGNYLLRSELIALHEGFELGGAQPYVGCAEITVGGSGTVNPGNLVSFPGAYKATDKGLLFDIYPVKGSYPIPGPSVYKSGSSTPATQAPTQSPATQAPTQSPTKAPTSAPTSAPTKAPTSAPTKAPTSAPTQAPSSGSCTLGYEKCSGESTYSSCYRAATGKNQWSADRQCQTGLVCRSWLDNYVICDRP